jgi:hypothetical protein
MILNFGDTSEKAAPAASAKPVVAEKPVVTEQVKPVDKSSDDDDEAVAPLAPLGLWGSPVPSDYTEKHRELAPKRRWTVNERSG